MAMSTFNTVRITQLNYYTKDICTTWKKNLTEQTNSWRICWNQTYGSLKKVMDPIEKKIQSVVHDHENVVKLAQHHRLAPGTLPHDVLDGIISHFI